MKAILFLSVVLFGLSSVAADATSADFLGKYVFIQTTNNKIKEYNVQFTKCFSVKPATVEILKTYEECQKVPLRSEVSEAKGQCSRKDGARAYFFDSLRECKEAKLDVENSAAA